MAYIRLYEDKPQKKTDQSTFGSGAAIISQLIDKTIDW